MYIYSKILKADMVLCTLAIVCEFLYFSLFLSVGRKCVKAFKSHEEIRRVASLQQFKDKQRNEIF